MPFFTTFTLEDEKRYEQLKSERKWFDSEYRALQEKKWNSEETKRILRIIEKGIVMANPPYSKVLNGVDTQECLLTLKDEIEELIPEEQALKELRQCPKERLYFATYRDGGSIRISTTTHSYLFKFSMDKMGYLNKVIKSRLK